MIKQQAWNLIADAYEKAARGEELTQHEQRITSQGLCHATVWVEPNNDKFDVTLTHELQKQVEEYGKISGWASQSYFWPLSDKLSRAKLARQFAEECKESKENNS